VSARTASAGPVTEEQLREDGSTTKVPRGAQYLGVSEGLFRAMIARGEIPSLRCGRLVRVPTEALIKFARGEG
jgi:excisionase family DNA binding protein